MFVNKCEDATNRVVRDGKAGLTMPTVARPIVAEPIQSLLGQSRHQATDPVIARFRAALKGIQTSELERLYHRLPELDEHSRAAICQFADCLVAKMLHPPLQSLQDECHRGSPHRLLESLQRLFRLNDSEAV